MCLHPSAGRATLDDEEEATLRAHLPGGGQDGGVLTRRFQRRGAPRLPSAFPAGLRDSIQRILLRVVVHRALHKTSEAGLADILSMVSEPGGFMPPELQDLMPTSYKAALTMLSDEFGVQCTQHVVYDMCHCFHIYRQSPTEQAACPKCAAPRQGCRKISYRCGGCSVKEAVLATVCCQYLVSLNTWRIVRVCMSCACHAPDTILNSPFVLIRSIYFRDSHLLSHVWSAHHAGKPSSNLSRASSAMTACAGHK